VEIHVSRLDATLFLPEGLELLFRNERKVGERSVNLILDCGSLCGIFE